MTARSERPPLEEARRARRRRRDAARRQRRRRLAALAVVVAVVVAVGVGFVSELGRSSESLLTQRRSPAAGGAPAPMDLSGGAWQLRLVRDGRSGPWRPARVPGLFDARPLRQEFLGMVGWYRLRFVAPRLPRGFSWSLDFQQARRSADVWLNGRHLGHRHNGFLPFTLPARGLRPGAANVLLVRVDNRRHSHMHEPWWNWGGIPRPVRLVPVGPAKLDELALIPRVSRSGGHWHARVAVSGTLRNHTARPVTSTVTVSLTAPSGAVSQRTSRPLVVRAGQSRPVRLGVAVRGRPSLWMPGHPSLYRATVQVAADGAPVQVERSRIGLRSIQVANGRLLLNGRIVQARGASVEEDLPGSGAALDDAGFDRLVADLKGLHADITRTQYLPDDRFLAKLDAAGIMVWSQAAGHLPERQLATPAGRAAALENVRATVLATRNHPSVIVHSVANELAARPDKRPGTRIFLRRAAALARRLDPAVPVAVDLRAAPGLPRQASYDQFDVLGLTTYFGWYRGLLGHPQGPLSELGPYLETMRSEYPAPAMMITEFGAEAMQHGPPALHSTYEFQSRYVDETLRTVDRESWLSGAIYFTARDFAIKPYWGGGAQLRRAQRDVFQNKGLLTYHGKPKPAAEVARRMFEAIPTFAPAAGP